MRLLWQHSIYLLYLLCVLFCVYFYFVFFLGGGGVRLCWLIIRSCVVKPDGQETGIVIELLLGKTPSYKRVKMFITVSPFKLLFNASILRNIIWTATRWQPSDRWNYRRTHRVTPERRKQKTVVNDCKTVANISQLFCLLHILPIQTECLHRSFH
jgi:hypothetical protein